VNREKILEVLSKNFSKPELKMNQKKLLEEQYDWFSFKVNSPAIIAMKGAKFNLYLTSFLLYFWIKGNSQ